MEQQKKRPVLLLVISIMSFLSIAFGIFQCFVFLMMGQLNAKQLAETQKQSAQILGLVEGNKGTVDQTMEKVNAIQVGIFSNVYTYAPVLLAAYVLALVGVIFMLKGKRNGFHMYIIYNLILIASIYLCLPANQVPVDYIFSNLFTSGLFVFLYGLNLKWMTK